LFAFLHPFAQLLSWYPESNDHIEKSINDEKLLPEKVAA
jgi:hypothetical protein